MSQIVYQFNDVNLSIGGLPVKGFAQEDNVIEVEPDVAERTNVKVGPDGFGVISVSPNKAGKLHIKLNQASPMNDTLALLLQTLDTNAPSVVPIFVKSSAGDDFVYAEVLPVNFPKGYAFSQDVGTYTWTFHTTSITIYPASISRTITATNL